MLQPKQVLPRNPHIQLEKTMAKPSPLNTFKRDVSDSIITTHELRVPHLNRNIMQSELSILSQICSYWQRPAVLLLPWFYLSDHSIDLSYEQSKYIPSCNQVSIISIKSYTIDGIFRKYSSATLVHSGTYPATYGESYMQNGNPIGRMWD